jgi:hypothetical protein
VEHSKNEIKCQICKKEYSPSCDWNQGRCPNHPPAITIPFWRKSVYLFFAPLIIGWWCIRNPRLVWAQAKKEYNIK